MSTPTQSKSAAIRPQRVRWSRQVPVRTNSSGRIVTRWLSRLGAVSTLSILAMAIAGCGMGSRGNFSPSRTLSDGSFRWTLTKLEGATAETQIGWLDNETVLFIGSNDSTDGSPEIRGLYAWDQKSPARLVLANAYRFCYDGRTWTAQTGEEQNGSNDLIYRRYQLNPSDLSTTWIGPDEVGPSDGFPNPYTCRYEKYPIQLRDRYWDALRPQDGYLDLGADGTRNQDVVLVSPDFKVRRSLGFKTKEPTGITISYSRYSGAYIAYDYIFSLETLAAWNRDKVLVIHSISPKGDMQTIAINTGPWSEELGGDRSIELTKPGIAISSKAGREPLNAESGLYLIIPKKGFIKLDGATISNLESSPDGCSLAYIQATQGLKVHLKTAKICSQFLQSNEAKQRTPT